MESILYMSGVSIMQNRYDLHYVCGRKRRAIAQNKVWMKYVRVVKVESIQIIRYGQYIKSGNNKWEKLRGKVKVGTHTTFTYVK